MDIVIKKIHNGGYYPYFEDISTSGNYFLIDIDRALEVVCELSEHEMVYIKPILDMDEVRGYQSLELWFKKNKPDFYKKYKKEITGLDNFAYVFMKIKEYLKTSVV